MKCSVVIATYNGEKYIKEQLDSILNQSIKPNEIVICDDVSTDNTLDIIYAIKCKEDIPIHIIQHKKNMGVQRTFLEAMNIATGDIVFFCDQDDYWYENKIEKFMKAFDCDGDITLAISDADIVDQNLNKKGNTLWETIDFKPLENMNSVQLVDEMLKRNIFTGMCMAVKREWISSLKISVSSEMLHDEEMGWYAIFAGRVCTINEKMVAYRQHFENVVGSSKTTKFESFKKMRQSVKKSSERSKNKFRELCENELTRDIPKLNKKLFEAFQFYSARVDFFSQSRMKSLVIFMKLIVGGGYGRFCSKTENAIKKDFICIIIR
ncbi:MAG: glycosyltransferase family 2 protein [Bacilli bacterium]